MIKTESLPARTNVTIRMETISRIDKFLMLDKSKDMGLTSRPDVITRALHEFLEKHESRHVIIRDNKTKVCIDATINRDSIFCNNCNKNNCIHVKNIRNDGSVFKQLKKRGYLF